MTNTTKENLLAETKSLDPAVLGKVRITIYKSAALAVISGGDAGPGAGAEPMSGVTYSWSLPIANIYTGPSQQMVIQTLNSCMSVIGAVAQQTCQSFSAAGSGNYDGDSVYIAGTQPYGSDSPSYPTNGQLQIRGDGIDLSSVNDPNFADLSLLPVGVFIAQPVNGVTKRILGIIIEE